MSQAFIESVVEEAALAWSESLDYAPLPKLLSGEIPVGDAERFFERASAAAEAPK